MSASGNKRPRLADVAEIKAEKTLGEQMTDLLRRQPKNYDVTFSVGPNKVEVKAVKFILKAVSPIFEKAFDEKWEPLKLKEGEGIPLPNLDPISFELFVNLLILDAWSVDSISALKLSRNNLLSILWLCRQYEITKAIKNLEQAAHAFIQSFDAYIPEVLEMSRETLETIFSFEKIPLDENEIFECACRWASNQCTIKGLEPTGENYRNVLGGCLFKIRFPTMSKEEFTQVNSLKVGLLKDEEKLAIYEYIGLSPEERTKYDKTGIQFNTNRRIHDGLFGYSVLSLPQQYKLGTSPPFVCDGSRKILHFQVNQKISLHRIGFLGPIDADTYIDVFVQICRKVEGDPAVIECGKFKKNIFARKGKMFYFILDEPVIVETSTINANWRNRYSIILRLKGTNNISNYTAENPKDELLQAAGVEFLLDQLWNMSNPLAQLYFKKI